MGKQTSVIGLIGSIAMAGRLVMARAFTLKVAAVLADSVLEAFFFLIQHLSYFPNKFHQFFMVVLNCCAFAKGRPVFLRFVFQLAPPALAARLMYSTVL